MRSLTILVSILAIPGLSNAASLEEDDAKYLYQQGKDLTVSTFTNVKGIRSFRAQRSDGLLLRGDYKNERFFDDESDGALKITYSITPISGGVKIIYDISNPSLDVAHSLPSLEVSGIGIDHASAHEYMDTFWAGNGTYKAVGDNAGVVQKYYPKSSYSPIILLKDKHFAAGAALQYPYLDYQVETFLIATKTVTNGLNTYRYRFALRDSLDQNAPGKIQPNTRQRYTLTLTFGAPRYGILTLWPYKNFFRALYSEPIPNADRRPVRGATLSLEERVSEDNPRGYGMSRPDINGWDGFIDPFLNENDSRGYRRSMLWKPSGAYDNPDWNFPTLFMNFHAKAEATAQNFWKFQERGHQLGGWWGLSSRVTIPHDATWEIEGLEVADLTNVQHVKFIKKQVSLAAQRGFQVVGLDTFSERSTFERVKHLKIMNQSTNGSIQWVHEPHGSDIIAKHAINIVRPNSQEETGGFLGADLLAFYLHGDVEIWALMQNGNDLYKPSLSLLQKWTKWGFTVVDLGATDEDEAFDVHNLNLSRSKCLNGLDDDGDGAADYPKDLGCVSPEDNSE